MLKRVALFAILAVGALDAFSAVCLPSFFSDGMVLQRDTLVFLYGYGEPDREIVLTPSWDGASQRTESDSEGFWRIGIRTPSGGGPYTIIVSDGEPTTLTDILIGEVWICSGQSNMAMKLSGGGSQPVDRSLASMMLSSRYADRIRFFNVENAVSDTLCRDVKSLGWTRCDPATVGDLSAVAYYFATYLTESLDVPVGVMVNAWGGSKIEAWMDRATYEESVSGTRPQEEKRNNRRPSGIFNAMVYPLTSYVAKGFLWYQGEANKEYPELYEKQMPLMVASWRKYWQNSEMPFYYAQIAPFGADDSAGTVIPDFVEVQVRMSERIPCSGIVGTTDLGEEHCLHPSAKDKVGFRFAHMALRSCYGLYGAKEIPATGPVVRASYKAGRCIILEFDQPISLQEHYEGFEIIRNDGTLEPVSNVSVGRTGRTLRLEVSDMNTVRSVQYAYHNYCRANMENIYGLPMFPFRRVLLERPVNEK